MQPEVIDRRNGFQLEGKRAWWCGRTSNSVGGVSRSRVGSTPASFRHYSGRRRCRSSSRKQAANTTIRQKTRERETRTNKPKQPTEATRSQERTDHFPDIVDLVMQHVDP